MRRRELIVSLAVAAATWPLAARAQQVRLVGMLMNGNSNEPALQANVNAFTEGLQNLGWALGRNLRTEVRWNGGNAERVREFAAELIALRPAAIVASSTTNLVALKDRTNTIPIVFLQVSDPVAQGFVASITKPGGNATGFSPYEFSVGSKWLDLLKEIVPKLSHVAVMSNPDVSPQTRFFLRAIETGASRLNVAVEAAPVHSMEEIERTIETVASTPDGAIIIPTDSYTRTRGPRIAALALKARVPIIGAFSEFIDQGGLIYYGPAMNEDMTDQYRQAASYVDRILKGTKPGDLPIQSASKFRLLINRKTATAFGLEIPPRLLFTADRVIE